MVHCDNDAGNVAIDEEEETYTYHHATYDDAQTTDVASKQKTDVADDASKQKTDVADDASKQKTGVADDSKKQKANDSSDTADVKKQKKKCSRHYGTDGPGIHFEWVPEQVRYAKYYERSYIDYESNFKDNAEKATLWRLATAVWGQENKWEGRSTDILPNEA
jgi:hypothetical protein